MDDWMITFGKAQENLQAARVCMGKHFANASVSRSYYAAAQAAAACLLKWDAMPPRPNHLNIYIGFVTGWKHRHGKSRHLDVPLALYSARQNADYNPTFRTNGKEAAHFFQLAANFVLMVSNKEFKWN